MWFTLVNLARCRRDRPSAPAADKRAPRRRTHVMRDRNDHARVAASGRTQIARACLLPASHVCALVGAELARMPGQHSESCECVVVERSR